MRLEWTLTIRPTARRATLKLPMPAVEPPDGPHSVMWTGRSVERATWSAPGVKQPLIARLEPVAVGAPKQPGLGEMMKITLPAALATAAEATLTLTLIDTVRAAMEAAPATIQLEPPTTTLGQVRSDTLSDPYTRGLVQQYRAQLQSGSITPRGLIEKLVAQLVDLPQAHSYRIRPADVIWQRSRDLQSALAATSPGGKQAVIDSLGEAFGADCDDRAMAMIMLLREVGIDCRQVTVAVNPATDATCRWHDDPAELGSSILHAIVEYRGPCGWEQCDPTCGTVGFVSPQFRLASGADGSDLRVVLEHATLQRAMLSLTLTPLGAAPVSNFDSAYPLRRRRLTLGNCEDLLTVPMAHPER